MHPDWMKNEYKAKTKTVKDSQSYFTGFADKQSANQAWVVILDDIDVGEVGVCEAGRVASLRRHLRRHLPIVCVGTTFMNHVILLLL